MGSAAETTEPTTGTEKHHHRPVELEEEEEIVALERKTSSFPHGKERFSTDSSTITNTTSSSSSFSGDGTEEISDFRTAIEDLKVPEIGFHEEEHPGNHCNVYLDGEQGVESADAEPDSQTAVCSNGEKKHSESANSSTSPDNKRPSEIEQVQDGDFFKNLDVVVLPTGDVIEEELDFEEGEYNEVEKLLDNQKTHHLICPKCDSCITEKVILQRRKRKVRRPLDKQKRPKLHPQLNDPPLCSGDSSQNADGAEKSVPESFVYKCLSCFTIFIPSGLGSKSLPESENVEGLETQRRPQEEATGDSNWFSSIFRFKKNESVNRQVRATSSVPEANRPRGNLSLPGDTTGCTASAPSKAAAFVLGGAVTSTDGSGVSQDKEPVDIPVNQVAVSHDTSQVVNNGEALEDGQKFPPPSAEEQKQGIDVSAVEGKNTSEKLRLSLIKPPPHMIISNDLTSGPAGITVKTIFHANGEVDTGNTGDITGPSSTEIDIPPVSSLGEGTLGEPLLRPVVGGRKLEILKSIVYGGLLESITSLGVISSAAGSGASMLNILVLGIANLLGGLILIIHNLQELRDEEPRITTTENNRQEEGRYKRLLGRRENFTLHASVAILSFIIVGLLPPVVYYFSFNKSHSIHKKDYKVASVFGASLLCIVLLAIAKAHAKTPRSSYLKSALYYTMIAVSVSGISYVVGNFVDQLLEKYGWSDGTETPAGEMMVSLMGRKAGYSSSY
ncbi:hypothetical protein AALP_AA7G116000 [Arabis alpina]|uniref:Membrane protein of ER body-like protein n=1 Tax=Arabis alpina TaxID=50452 RepID=A0A087GHF4_ARAAL|nr:hypothetical protein AALP_AA7G116000 [Arabis alpina]